MNLSSILQRYWMFRRFFQELTSGLRAVGARALQFSSPASYMAVENKKIPLLLFLAGEESNGAATVACSFLPGKKEEWSGQRYGWSWTKVARVETQAENIQTFISLCCN